MDEYKLSQLVLYREMNGYFSLEEEERERMRKKVEKAPILSLLFENKGKENDSWNGMV